MFQLTIKNQNVTEMFESRDNLMIRLETENKKCKTEQFEAICQIVQTNKDGEVLDKISLDLPLIDLGLDEALLDFGKSKSFIPNSITRQKPKATIVEEEELVSEAESVKKELVSSQSGKRKSSFLPILLLVLSLSAFALSFLNYVTTQKHVAQIAELQKTQSNSSAQTENDIGKMDVFCRYFLPNYYSGTASQLEDFTDSNTDIVGKEGILQSVLLESHKIRNRQMTLTYVIAVKVQEEVIKKRISLSVKKQADSHYGYLVIKNPEESQYP